MSGGILAEMIKGKSGLSGKRIRNERILRRHNSRNRSRRALLRSESAFQVESSDDHKCNRADQSDSFLAQGGICMLRGEEDYDNYFEDTMRAGHYENNKKAVDLMIRSSNSIIRDLIRHNVTFERDANGELAFTREGAHSQPRILFYEDVTGKQTLRHS